MLLCMIRAKQHEDGDHVVLHGSWNNMGCMVGTMLFCLGLATINMLSITKL